jgi:hypothetical protein
VPAGEPPREPEPAAAPSPEKSVPIDRVAATGPAASPAPRTFLETPEAGTFAAVERRLQPEAEGEHGTAPPSSAPDEPRAGPVPARKGRRSGGGAVRYVLLVAILAMTGAGYRYRTRLRPWVALHVKPLMSAGHAASAPIPTGGTPAPASSPLTVTPTPSPAASPNVDSTQAPRERTETGDAGPSMPISGASPHRPTPHAPKHHGTPPSP